MIQIIIMIIIFLIIEHILLITMLFLFTANSPKKAIPSKHYLQFLSFQTTHFISIKTIHFDLKKKLFSRSLAFLQRKSLKRGNEIAFSMPY